MKANNDRKVNAHGQMIAAVAISDDDENCGETVPFGERSDGQKGGWQTDEQSDLSGLRLGRTIRWIARGRLLPVWSFSVVSGWLWCMELSGVAW
jgi:hypothetical protein